MTEMTPRERFRAVMHFNKPDRLPLCEWFGYSEETISRWIKEGLPQKEITDQISVFSSRTGITLSSQCLDIGKYFNLEISPVLKWYKLSVRALGHLIDVDLGPIPRFVPRILEENDRHRIYVDEVGITKKVIRGRTYFMPQFIDWPVKNKEDFEEMKKRFNPDDPRRESKTWSDELIEYYKTTQYPVGVHIPGLFMQLRNFMGEVKSLLTFFTDPDLVYEIINFWADFLIKTLEKPITSLKGAIDYVMLSEDIAEKHGPFISPRHFRELFLPCYKKVTEFFRRNKIDIIIVDSDGNLNTLVPLYLESGVNCLLPLEVAAGMNAVELRKKYGKRLRLIGNIDKRALIKGKTEIEKEIESKLPYLKEEGGYIPSVDHWVSHDIPFENYKYYISYLRKLL